MTVTPIGARDHRPAPPNSPRGRRAVGRRWVGPAGTGSQPDALIVSFEVTLAGETRYAEALKILDTLRQATAHLGATLEVVPVTDEFGPGPVPLPSAVAALPAGGIEILVEARRVMVDGEEIMLTRVEFDLLVFLAEHPARVFDRSQLLRSVWGYEHAGRRTVDVHMRRLRAKLGDRLVTTVRGVGYRLTDGAMVRVIRPG